MMKMSEVFTHAADLISAPGAWTKGAEARTAERYSCNPYDPRAICWCAYGAMRLFSPNADRLIDAVEFLEHHVLGELTAGFNDRQTEAGPVIEWLRFAAQRAKEIDR